MTDPQSLASVRTFPKLVEYLRDELDWPIESADFEELYFEYTAEELGIDSRNAAKIDEIKRLRPLVAKQPWGIFFVRFVPGRLPVVALRRILNAVVMKQRASASGADRVAWETEDLLFVSNYGEGDQRQISFAHFAHAPEQAGLPTLNVLGWDNLDTALHIDHVGATLKSRLAWPDDPSDIDAWREKWRSAFTLRHREVIDTSKGLAVRLAHLARGLRDRINTILSVETPRGPINQLMQAFQRALVQDLDGDGFADMYAQTIAYGLLSAEIADPRAGGQAGSSQIPVTNPFLKELMETFLHVGVDNPQRRGIGDFDELGIHEVTELLEAANMQAVVRDFGDKNPQEDPVIHFYELFLKEYDAKKRMQRGVFYTPRPVVSYIVRSVHQVLQTEFSLTDGIADTSTWAQVAHRAGVAVPDGVEPSDPFVTILDPAAGTGTFLVEAIEIIHRVLVEKWKREDRRDDEILDLWNDYVPNHLLPRLHGYELLMAPYAIAHLKIGLKLHETGYSFQSSERTRVYLTNAVEPPQDFSGQIDFAVAALAHEARAVNEVKHHQRFTVVIGNPPYSTISQNRNAWIRGLVETYWHLDEGRMEERGNRNQLQDDYVKFFRLAHHLTEGGGVMGMITNSSYLRGPWFRGMRYQLTRGFDAIDVFDLHGGQSHSLDQHGVDQNVFEITTSVAIAVLRRRLQGNREEKVRYAEARGSRQSKYDLLTKGSCLDQDHETLAPSPENQWRLVPHDPTGQEEWSAWTALPELFNSWGAGVLTNRNGLAVAKDRGSLLQKIRRFADLTIPDDALEAEYGFSSNYQWTTGRARKAFASQPVRDLAEPYTFRPFDYQWIYWHSNIVYNMRGEKMEVFRQPDAPLGLMFSRNTRHPYYSNIYITRHIADRHCIEEANVAPLFQQTSEGLLPQAHESNLSRVAVGAIADGFGLTLVPETRGDFVGTFGAEDFLFYLYGILHSAEYRSRFAEFLKIDFPRVPVAGDREMARELSQLGREVATLHLAGTPQQQGVTAHFDDGTGRWLYDVAPEAPPSISLSFDGPKTPVAGKVAWSNDTVWLDASRAKTGDSAEVAGPAAFHGVPRDVWSFHIGGYQVCEKWLKDRKGIPLRSDDVAHYYRIVIGLHETIRLMRRIDETIDRYGGWQAAFKANLTARHSSAETQRRDGSGH